MHNFRELEMSLISIGTLGGTIAMVEGGSGGGVVPT